VARRTIRPELVPLVMGCAMASACQTPTEVTIEIDSELGYRSDTVVSVQLDAPERVETAPPRIVSRDPWAEGGTVGTVVAVPSGDRDDFAVRVVLATGREPTTCTRTDATGCIVVRRRLHFATEQSTRARVVLRAACLGVFCDDTSSCAADGKCGTIDSDEGASDGGAPPSDAAGSDPYAAVVLMDRPRHYYRFDEPPGSPVARDTMGRAHGTYDVGVKLGVTGALAVSTNTGAFFDGSGAGVSIPKVEDLPGAFTIEAWQRADGGSARPTIVERVDIALGLPFGYRVSTPSGFSAAFEVFRGGAPFAAKALALRFAGYIHVVAVTQGKSILVYVDGREPTVSTLDDTKPVALLGPLFVGTSRSGADPWRGAIDELAIYDYPFDLEQVKRHRNAAGPR
jgi:hypothetical protein